MKKILLFIALGVTLALVFLSLILKNNSGKLNKINSSNKISVRLKWVNQAQFAGFYVANENWLYSGQGLDVTLNPGGPDISPIQMVISGVDHFGVIGADQILLAREKGVPVVAVAVIYKNSPVALASLQEKNIKSPNDLIGKKVAIVYGKDEELIYKSLLKKENIDRSTINEVPLTFDLSQITSNKVDAQIVYEMNEPILLKQKGFDLNLIKPRDYGIDFYADVIFTTEDFINKNPEVVKKFVRSTMEGWRKAIDNPTEAVDLVLKVNNTLDRNHQMEFLQRSIPLIQNADGLGVFNHSRWEEMQKIMIEQEAMKNKIELEKAYTNDFVK